MEKKINRFGNVSYWEEGEIIKKQCNKCKEIKDIDNYYLLDKKKKKYSGQCKECISGQYYKNNKEKVLEKQREYYKNNKEEIVKHRKEYYKNNKEKISRKRKENYKNNKEEIIERQKQYYENNKEKKVEYSKEHYKQYREYYKQYRENNREKLKEYKKQWRENNRERIKEYNKKLKEAQYYKEYFENNKESYRVSRNQYYKNNTKHIKEQKKQYRKEIKEANIQNISNMLEQINVTFKRLNLPIYGTIYKFENTNTGRIYIGQTILSLNGRYGSDIVDNWIKERFEKDNQKFKEELIKQDIRVDIIDVAFCKYHLDKLEAYYINKYNSFNNGYNNNAGYHDSDDGIEEFNELLQKYNLQFIDGKLIECA